MMIEMMPLFRKRNGTRKGVDETHLEILEIFRDRFETKKIVDARRQKVSVNFYRLKLESSIF